MAFSVFFCLIKQLKIYASQFFWWKELKIYLCNLNFNLTLKQEFKHFYYQYLTKWIIQLHYFPSWRRIHRIFTTECCIINAKLKWKKSLLVTSAYTHRICMNKNAVSWTVSRSVWNTNWAKSALNFIKYLY